MSDAKETNGANDSNNGANGNDADALTPTTPDPPAVSNASSVYEFTVKDLDGNEVSLEKYRGQVLVIVNVASKCGFAKKNYDQLNQLYSKHKDAGLKILGFPCSQFMNQEPGCAVDIKEFIQKNGVEWDVFDKIDVNGKNAHPLFTYLKSKQSGFLMSAIKWNFTKFLVNRQGIPVARFAPTTEPNAIEKDLIALLQPEAPAADAKPSS